MRETKLLAGGEGAGEDDLVRAAGVDGAGDLEQVASAFPFQLVPQLEGAQQQRHVRRVLVVGETDDARDAVRRAHRVRNVEALQPQRAQAAPRQVIAGGGAHTADADDDRVVDP